MCDRGLAFEFVEDRLDASFGQSDSELPLQNPNNVVDLLARSAQLEQLVELVELDRLGMIACGCLNLPQNFNEPPYSCLLAVSSCDAAAVHIRHDVRQRLFLLSESLS